ncbi:hypothetical protein HNR42_003519 [Deinobacterium chartae]|uniref:Uncharacterized protein n=1 Tax=Deinobacterium chartae TaxID=521158 RepID=A0A841I4U6_9DEIO|nr:hypothetical protein [Deinobacterium chartae]MBB6100054.1 hypothetical protein [Deinobacterium chartae]
MSTRPHPAPLLRDLEDLTEADLDRPLLLAVQGRVRGLYQPLAEPAPLADEDEETALLRSIFERR